MTLTELTLISAPGISAAILSWLNRNKITEVHLLINSRLTQLLEVTKQAAHLAGEAAQRDKDAKDP